MKIAITSTGNTLESIIDSRFGRCAYFAVYDTMNKTTVFIPNHNQNADGGAGPASVQTISLQGVKKVISGEFGVKVKPLFASLNIETVIIKEQEQTVKSIIESLI